MRTVLLIDDAGLIRALQGSFLNRQEVRVSTVEAGALLERAAAERPDLVLLASAAGEAGILEACREIKSDPTLRKTPVIISAPDSEHLRCSKAGADAVLTYPPSREHVIESVRTLLPASLRASRRRSASLRVSYFRGDEERLGYSKDLAVEGLFLRTREDFAVGDPLQMIFELPGQDRPTIRAEGDVVRRIEPDRDSHLIPGIGVRFRSLSARDRRELERFVGEAP